MRKHRHSHATDVPPKQPPEQPPLPDPAADLRSHLSEVMGDEIIENMWLQWRDHVLIPRLRLNKGFQDGEPIPKAVFLGYRAAFFNGMTAGVIAISAPLKAGFPLELFRSWVADLQARARHQADAALHGENRHLDEVG